jgi:hypothetical protein
MAYQLVFYSPGPYCNTDTYEVIDFDTQPSEATLAEEGYQRAVEHYECYQDYDEDDGIEPEYDYCWYAIDDPEVEGHI